MTQSVVVQVGQCGNQIGCCFWDLALREHAAVNQKGIYDEALSSFFRNVDARVVGDGGSISKGKISSLKARAVLIDMEEGVVNEILQGPLRDVFDSKQLITDISGSGNNWAVGHKVFGSAYQEQILEKLRKSAEHCDCLQCFFIIHSMGGELACVVPHPNWRKAFLAWSHVCFPKNLRSLSLTISPFSSPIRKQRVEEILSVS